MRQQIEKIRKKETEEAMIQKTTEKETEQATVEKDHSRKCNRDGEWIQWSNDGCNGGGPQLGHYNYFNYCAPFSETNDYNFKNSLDYIYFEIIYFH